MGDTCMANHQPPHSARTRCSSILKRMSSTSTEIGTKVVHLAQGEVDQGYGSQPGVPQQASAKLHDVWGDARIGSGTRGRHSIDPGQPAMQSRSE